MHILAVYCVFILYRLLTSLLFLTCLRVQVQLQHRIKQEAEQFRQWKASREKELLQVLFFFVRSII